MKRTILLTTIILLLVALGLILKFSSNKNQTTVDTVNNSSDIPYENDSVVSFEGTTYTVKDKFSLIYPKDWRFRENLNVDDPENRATADGPYGLIEHEWDLTDYKPLIIEGNTETPEKGIKMTFQIIKRNESYNIGTLGECEEFGAQCAQGTINGTDYIKAYIPKEGEQVSKYIANKDNYLYYVRASIYGSDPNDPEYQEKSLRLIEEVTRTFKIL
jgi:hypothetical protein